MAHKWKEPGNYHCKLAQDCSPVVLGSKTVLLVLKTGFRGRLRFWIRSIKDSKLSSELSDSTPVHCVSATVGNLFSVFSQLLSFLLTSKSGVPLKTDSFRFCGSERFMHFWLPFKSFTPSFWWLLHGLSTKTESSMSLEESGYCNSWQQVFLFPGVFSFFEVWRSFRAAIQKKELKVLGVAFRRPAFVLRQESTKNSNLYFHFFYYGWLLTTLGCALFHFQIQEEIIWIINEVFQTVKKKGKLCGIKVGVSRKTDSKFALLKQQSKKSHPI